MTVEVCETAFDPNTELRRYQQQVLGRRGKVGATVSFIGSMRDFNDDASVQAMTLEHYPGMTEKHLQRLTEEAMVRWEILDALILHRVGELLPNDPIVLVAVWSAHREPAFEACRYLIEELKTRAPFWKKEQRPTVERWVEHNTPISEKRSR